MTQIPTATQLIPFEALSLEEAGADSPVGTGQQALFIYEPDESTLLEALLPKNLEVQIYRALLETFASEQGARMTAMDSATRNAGDMIKRLDLTYNRARQAYITKELIEIISGAEAL
jgi:F-type H+-transporting ATPase subunit gamma